MDFFLAVPAIVFAGVALTGTACPAAADDFFTPPERGFISDQPAHGWENGIVTGNGTLGAVVLGNPYDETLFLSQASLYLPRPTNPGYINVAAHLEEIRKLCLDGNYAGAANLLNTARKETSYDDQRDPFIGAFELHIRQPGGDRPTRYQRAVNTMTAETSVSVADGTGSFQRRAFASRPDNVLVLSLRGSGKQTADFSFASLAVVGDKQKAVVAQSIKSTEQGVKDGLLYFRTLFAHGNPHNPNMGYEGVGKVITRGGRRTETAAGIHIEDADEILVLIKIRPLLVKEQVESGLDEVRRQLDALPTDYDRLLAPQAKVQGDLMGRVSLSLDAPAEDRAKSNEQLASDAASPAAALAKIERAFDAGRYNVICSTGFYPPNLQGLWSGTWAAPWAGSFTTDGNLPAAVAFLLMGNTPELMQSFFRYYDERWRGFRENARMFYNMRGFHVPAQLTLSPRETDFTTHYPLCFWHAAAPWALEFYYDYYRYTGDQKFLAERAYPLIKEAAAFYEDFLTVKGQDGKLVFVPDYSPENTPGGEKQVPTTINATMDIAAAKQLLANAIAAAKLLDQDADLQAKWAKLIEGMPAYEAGPDGSFREWLWPGVQENHQHRHASQLYPLYDERPPEIVENAALVKAVEHTIGERLAFREKDSQMAFGVVQLGLAATHIGNAGLAERTIDLLARGYWSTGMVSFHNWQHLFNIDISGGFPYLCASALVYSEPGHVWFFPARPPGWQRGSLRGVRLRGGIVVRELTWDGPKAEATLVSDTDQTIAVGTPDGCSWSCVLRAGVAFCVDL